MREPGWRREGQEPDYRFSLANERTFLAWIRTALALLAAAIGIDQLVPGLATTRVRTVFGCLLATAALTASSTAYRRWACNERAMRHNAPLPHSRILLSAAMAAAVAAAVCCWLFVSAP